MGWFISIMTPFWVTRQFHCPEVFFLLYLSQAVLMEWSEIRLGTREEALVNAHEQSLSFPVSAREVTIKRGDEAESLSHQRETDFEFFLLFFSEEVSVKCWTSKHTAFWFSFFPLILLYKSTWQHVCISKYSHQKACKKTSSHFVLFMVSAKLPFTLISY